MITFQFDHMKAIEAMAFFAQHVPGIEKVKITKMMYLADKAHFLEFGWPITGDRQFAMLHGPVPGGCLDALDGEVSPEETFKYLHVNDYQIYVRRDPGAKSLEHSEMTVLRQTLRNYGGRNVWALRDETHLLPEYQEAYRAGTSAPIPYEMILKHSGDPRHYRLNRPVISREMREHMACPIPE